MTETSASALAEPGRSASRDNPLLTRSTLPLEAPPSDEIYLNGALFRRVEAIYVKRDELQLDAEDRRLLERYRRDFLRAGALLSGADKARVRALNEEDAKLQAEFENKLREATRSAA